MGRDAGVFAGPSGAGRHVAHSAGLFITAMQIDYLDTLLVISTLCSICWRGSPYIKAEHQEKGHPYY